MTGEENVLPEVETISKGENAPELKIALEKEILQKMEDTSEEGNAMELDATVLGEGNTPAPEDTSYISPEEDALQAKETLRDMAAGIAASAALIAVLGLIFAKGIRLTFCLGVLLGAGTAGLMLWHMYVTIDRALDMDSDSAVKYTKKSATLRILMAAAAFAISALLPQVFHVAGTLFGTLCLKFSAYLQPLTHKALKNLRKGR